MTLLISCLPALAQAIPEVKCRTESDSYGPKCVLEGIHDRTNEGRIKIIGGNRGVKGVTLHKSFVKTISSDICDTFPKTRNLEINGVSAEKIGKYPFVNCKNLAFLWIINNELESIEADVDIHTFAHNQKLEFLSLYNNDLLTLSNSGEVFQDLTGLKQLWLSSNCLTDFPKKLMMQLPKTLTTIYVDSNHLTDLDAESMIKIFPKLLRVHFMNVGIPKARLDRINKVFQAKDIATDYNRQPFKKQCG